MPLSAVTSSGTGRGVNLTNAQGTPTEPPPTTGQIVTNTNTSTSTATDSPKIAIDPMLEATQAREDMVRRMDSFPCGPIFPAGKATLSSALITLVGSASQAIWSNPFSTPQQVFIRYPGPFFAEPPIAYGFLSRGEWQQLLLGHETRHLIGQDGYDDSRDRNHSITAMVYKHCF